MSVAAALVLLPENSTRTPPITSASSESQHDEGVSGYFGSGDTDAGCELAFYFTSMFGNEAPCIGEGGSMYTLRPPEIWLSCPGEFERLVGVHTTPL